ncbi:hypothetical protein HS125_11275 [bacterium]|nr:hypothetical protein [bacterium]
MLGAIIVAERSKDVRAVYTFAGVNLDDPCAVAVGVAMLTASWIGDPEATAAEIQGMITGVQFHCECGNVQDVEMKDLSAVILAVEDFNKSLKANTGDGRQTSVPHIKSVLKTILQNAAQEAACMSANFRSAYPVEPPILSWRRLLKPEMQTLQDDGRTTNAS